MVSDRGSRFSFQGPDKVAANDVSGATGLADLSENGPGDAGVCEMAELHFPAKSIDEKSALHKRRLVGAIKKAITVLVFDELRASFQWLCSIGEFGRSFAE